MKNLGAPFASLAFCLSLFTQGSAAAYEARWSLGETERGVTAVDCTDCEEDAAILIMCQGPNMPAKVVVNGAATETEPDEQNKTVSFEVSGQTFSFEAHPRLYGLIGHTPEFNLAKDDPFFEALKQSPSATVAFNGEISSINLNNSYRVLTVFNEQCSWGQGPNYSAMQGAKILPKVSDSGAFWFTGDGFGEGTNKQLTYGVPETDQVAFSARCGTSSQDPIDLELFLPLGDLRDGEIGMVEFVGGDNTRTLPARAFIENDEYAGLRLALEPDAEIWNLISAENGLSLGLVNHVRDTIETDGAQAPTQHFLAACSKV